jgi:hypothetical protein
MIDAVARPKRNGMNVASWEKNAASMSCLREAVAGMYRDQSPRNAPNDSGLDITISVEPMNAGRNDSRVPSKLASKSGPYATAPRMYSSVAVTTATLLTASMKRKPYRQTTRITTAKSA